MKHIYKILILAISLVIMVDAVFASGGNRTGTGGAAQLLIPVGARSIAMGSSTIQLHNHKKPIWSFYEHIKCWKDATPSAKHKGQTYTFDNLGKT